MLKKQVHKYICVSITFKSYKIQITFICVCPSNFIIWMEIGIVPVLAKSDRNSLSWKTFILYLSFSTFWQSIFTVSFTGWFTTKLPTLTFVTRNLIQFLCWWICMGVGLWRCYRTCVTRTPCRNFSNFFLKMTISVISVHILALVSMRKYILNHK